MILTRFKPLLAGAQPGERLVSCIAAAVCIGLTFAICALVTAPGLPVLMAPLGASAVLVLAVPTSPLAQPWPAIGGNALSALLGVAVARWVPDLALASGLAVGGAILLMSICRCLHPPGGAAALTAVIGGDAVREAGFAFALWPVAANTVVLVLLATVAHRVARRSYPHRPPAPKPDAADLTDDDVDAALAEMDEAFDIDREDLRVLLSSARRHARARRG